MRGACVNRRRDEGVRVCVVQAQCRDRPADMAPWAEPGMWRRAGGESGRVQT